MREWLRIEAHSDSDLPRVLWLLCDSRQPNCSLLALWSATLASPVISSWLAKDKWTAKPAKEAFLLPLHCVVSFERAVASCDCSRRWLLLCFLSMLWGSLRWSDCQRVEIASTHLDDECLRCWVWRPRTSASGFPFGVLSGGAISGQWGAELGRALLTLAKQCPRRDFLLARGGTPMPCATALPKLRRCLVLYGGLSGDAL